MGASARSLERYRDWIRVRLGLDGDQERARQVATRAMLAAAQTMDCPRLSSMPRFLLRSAVNYPRSAPSFGWRERPVRSLMMTGVERFMLVSRHPL